MSLRGIGAALRPLSPAALGLAAVALLLLALGEFTDIDLRLADAMFDAVRGAFPWQHVWFAEVLLHVRLRQAMSAVGAALILLVALDAVAPWKVLDAQNRLRLRTIAATAVVIPLAVSLLKAMAFSHCPWELSRYGGGAPYVRLLETAPPGVHSGHCFPAGHATSALWLIAFALWWTPQAPRNAAAVAASAVAAGVALGLLQQMRGAHFLSHTLWSAWLAVVIYQVAAGWLKRRLARAGSHQPSAEITFSSEGTRTSQRIPDGRLSSQRTSPSS